MFKIPTPVEKESAQNSIVAKESQRSFRMVDIVAFIVCFAIALSVWTFVASTENEEYEYTFTDIVVKYDGVAQLQSEHGLSIISEYQTKVSITVKGFRSEIVKYSSEDFFAHVDVDSISEAGMHSLDVITELPEGKMSIVSTSPSSINVLVDETSTKEVPVRVNVRYNIQDTLTLHDPVPEINKIEVVGPKSRIEEVAYAEVSYDLGTVTSGVNFKGSISLYDEGGNKIENPYVKPAVGEVSVKVKVTAKKTVPLAASFTARDLNRFDYSVVFTPTHVTLVGDPLELERYENITVGLGDITETDDGSFVISEKIKLPVEVAFEDGQRDMEVKYVIEKTAKKVSDE